MPVALAFSMSAFVACDKSEEKADGASKEVKKESAVAAAVNDARFNEVTNQVSAYVLMQNAYIAANGSAGDLKDIGFQIPEKSDNFEFVSIGNGIWIKSKVAMGDCVEGSVWNIRSISQDGKPSHDCTFYSPADKPCPAQTSAFEALCKI